MFKLKTKAMKLFFGVLSAVLIIAGAAITLLALWGIQPISWVIVLKALITVAIVSVAFLLLWLIKTIFFKKKEQIENRF